MTPRKPAAKRKRPTKAASSTGTFESRYAANLARNELEPAERELVRVVELADGAGYTLEPLEA